MDYNILIDTPANNPSLGFNRYAEALANLIRFNQPRFAVGVFGSWGSGKTTLMQATRAKLEGADPNVILCDFSAWRYQGESHLIIPLLETIKDALLDWSTQLSNTSPVAPDARAQSGLLALAQKTGATISKTVTALLAGLSFEVGMPNALKLSFDANKALEKARLEAASDGNNPQLSQSQTQVLDERRIPRSVYYACFRALKDAFRTFAAGTGRPRIVVFVDDLDRCLPVGALQILEAIKLFFDLEGFVFVVGVDAVVVERFIETQYMVTVQGVQAPLLRGADYLKKIFQVPFSLPPVSITQLDDFIEALCIDAASALPLTQQNDLRAQVRAHLAFVTTGSTVNARQVKRYINAYSLQMLVDSSLDKDAVLSVLSMHFREDWNDVLVALQTYGSEFLVALGELLRTGNMAVVAEFAKNVPDSVRAYLRGPASALLSESVIGDIDRYVFSGASVSQGIGPEFVAIQKRAIELRALLRVLCEDPAKLQSRASEGKSLADQLLGQLGAWESYGPEPRLATEETMTLFGSLLNAATPQLAVAQQDALRLAERLQIAISGLRRRLR
jgi:hypothetical protein